MYYAFLVVTDTRKGGTGKNMPLLFLAPHPAIGGQASAGKLRKVTPIVIGTKSTKNPQRGRQAENKIIIILFLAQEKYQKNMHLKRNPKIIFRSAKIN
jgi:hypothetical protein